MSEMPACDVCGEPINTHLHRTVDLGPSLDEACDDGSLLERRRREGHVPQWHEREDP